MTASEMPPPSHDDIIMRDGVRVRYRVFAPAAPAAGTVLLLPPWIITASDIWAPQVRALAQCTRVVVVDGRGSGGSDRPPATAAYRPDAYAEDALAVLDAVGAASAHLVGLSFGGHVAALLAARHPERMSSATLIAPSAPFGPSNPAMTAERFLAPWRGGEGWDLFNRAAWLADYESFARFFVREAVGEEGCEDLIARGVRWALEVDAATLVRGVLARAQTAAAEGEALYRQIRCPVQVLHGACDRIVPVAKGRYVAALLGAPFRELAGAGHAPVATRAAEVNRALLAFLERIGPAARPQAVA